MTTCAPNLFRSLCKPAVMLLAVCFCQIAVAEQPPNILLILADDLGFSDPGCYGGDIQTPNLDGLAERGRRWTQFYNTARCWPTRASLLTGYYAQQVRRDTVPHVRSGGGGRRPKWAKLLPERLRQAGYRSYHTGKWHLDGMPLQNGFNRSYYLKDQGRFFNPTKHWKDDQPLPPVPPGTDFYATTALADHAVEVLQQHAQEYNEQPFFHYLAFAAPHFPLHAMPEDIAVYDGQYDAGWDQIRRQRWQRQQQLGFWQHDSVQRLSSPEQELGPPYHFPDALKILGPGEVNRPLPWNRLNDAQQQFQAAKMELHAAMIHRMDLEIGRVLQQIEAMGQTDNTLVLFLSDNGASAEIMVRDDGHDPAASPGSAETYLCLGPGWSTSSNTPFRRHKTWTHEGGISTPLIVSWPDRISASQRGSLCQRPGHVVDVVPTLLELAGVEVEAPPVEFAGRSFATELMDGNGEKTSAAEAEREFWWFHDGHRAIRVGDWKAVSPVGEPWELYDLANDRTETTDLAIVHSAKLDELVDAWHQRLKQYTEDAIADLPDAQQQTARQPFDFTTVRSGAQRAALPQRQQVLINAEQMMIAGRPAFVMQPTETPEQPSENTDGKPWIFYAPTLRQYPDKAESWMHQQFVDAGVAVAGIDVGEAYGSPHALKFFDALYEHMVQQGYSKKPALFGRSRGGLWVSSWAVKNVDRVAGLGGIYPVYDYTTYPGVERAATAYGITAEQLEAQQATLNPIRQMQKLAAAKVPVCIIHGTNDKVVPIEQNSQALQQLYEQANAAQQMELIEAAGQGHSFWPGYFTCQPLVDFLIQAAKHETP